MYGGFVCPAGTRTSPSLFLFLIFSPTLSNDYDDTATAEYLTSSRACVLRTFESRVRAVWENRGSRWTTDRPKDEEEDEEALGAALYLSMCVCVCTKVKDVCGWLDDDDDDGEKRKKSPNPKTFFLLARVLYPRCSIKSHRRKRRPARLIWPEKIRSHIGRWKWEKKERTSSHLFVLFSRRKKCR